MQNTLVMTMIGQDRPGLVEQVADVVAEHGGNWLESSMSRLGGHFAGILRVEIPKERETALLKDLGLLAAKGITVVAHSDGSRQEAVEGQHYVLEIVAQDRPGIVRQITSALADYGVNVEGLETECASAAMSGETMFTARAGIRIPPGSDIAAIRQTLEKIASDLIADMKLEGA
ncbi:MAG: ACT domain-containing protein [Verrucomicrobia bacterium]|nr:ACT domain-containing protein [Verrucomicrobiota bacterium]